MYRVCKGQAVLRIKQLTLAWNCVAYAGLEFLIILPLPPVPGFQEFMMWGFSLLPRLTLKYGAQGIFCFKESSSSLDGRPAT